MSWLGAGIGALFGSRSGGLLGGIVGAVLGSWLEEKAKTAFKSQQEDEPERRHASDGELATLAAIAAMLSKLAKADGVITADEVRYCEGVFDRLGLRGEKREFCIRVFRTAKSDSHTIYEYADSFAAAQPSITVREVVYGILWDLACADGEVSRAEFEILRAIVPHLRLNRTIFEWERSQRNVFGGADGERSPTDPYEVLGCSRSSTDEQLKKAYREKAKQLHPDVLRSQGLSEELVSRANEQMARVNAAWAEIKKDRRL